MPNLYMENNYLPLGKKPVMLDLILLWIPFLRQNERVDHTLYMDIVSFCEPSRQHTAIKHEQHIHTQTKTKTHLFLFTKYILKNKILHASIKNNVLRIYTHDMINESKLE